MRKRVIQLHEVKKCGISPCDINDGDIKVSFNLMDPGNYQRKKRKKKGDQQQDDDEVAIPWLERIIIDHTGRFSYVIESINALACLTSPYLYMYKGSFHGDLIDEQLFTFGNVLECWFLLHMISQFITSHMNTRNREQRVIDFFTISERYLRGSFLQDLIPLIPFQLAAFGKYHQMSFLIKTVRLYKGFKVVNVRQFMNQMMILKRRSVEKKLLQNPEINDNRL